MIEEIYKIIGIPESYWTQFNSSYTELLVTNLLVESLKDIPAELKNEINVLVNRSDSEGLQVWFKDHRNMLANKDANLEMVIQETLNQFVDTLIDDVSEEKKMAVISYLKNTNTDGN